MTKPAKKEVSSRSVSSVSVDTSYIPEKDLTYVRWGLFSTVLKIVKSQQFVPVFVSGISGNGKTMMIQQACAAAQRDCIRIQITRETNEDDLLGGFRLIDGETVFQKGPVIKAMEAGAILLIDEIDRASEKIMCLQGILEGQPVLLKKTGELITPANGFNVIGTGNTKGDGNGDSKYSTSTILDAAFLERFALFFEQKFPTKITEMKILEKHASKYGIEDSTFLNYLIKWSDVIRETFKTGAVEDVISTRRMCNIIKAYSILGDKNLALESCISNFAEDTYMSFMDLFSKISLEASEDGEDKTYNLDDDDDDEKEEPPF